MFNGAVRYSIEAALKQAEYETLEDGTVFGAIPGLDGVWSNTDTYGEAEAELAEVLEEWIYLRLSKNLPVPTIGGIDIKAPSLA
jgi:predicted RNase H-like HicB family nuclease